jgi:hypothetical protein
MICLCEPSFHDGAHVPFNAGLIATIRSAFPKDDISFYGAAGHTEELKKQIGQPIAASILWREILPPGPGTPYFRRFFRELNILRRLRKDLSQEAASRLVLTSAYPSTVLASKLSTFFQSRQVPTQIVLHGLSGVAEKRYRRPILRCQDMRTALTLLGNKNIQYIVLEQSIRDTVVRNLPFLAARIEVLEHPISPNEGAAAAVDLSDDSMRFGFLGLADMAKGFPTFLELANCVVARYGRRAEFHAIGRFPQNWQPAKGMEVLATRPGRMRLTRSEFIRSIMPLHYIVLPHQPASYNLTASGVLLDAMAWEKPVIARKIPIFEAMFERHGDIGYLFNDDSELRAIVDQMLQTADKSRYQTQVQNLQSARKSRAPETLAQAYREMCGNSE